MTQPTPSHLRLHIEEAPVAPPPVAPPSLLDEVCEAFSRATGLQLSVSPVDQTAPPRDLLWSTLIADGGPTLQLAAPAANRSASGTAAEDAQDLAQALARLLNELHAARVALWRREAELAASVPLVADATDDRNHLAARLEAVLSGAAATVDGCAAALYLLDDATSELKLRSAWRLPRNRFTAPARPLRGSIADLEALAGHAVVLEDASLLPHWRSPEDFPSAVCVPVSSATTPLGTLWVFGDRVRDYSDKETNLLEIVAGRLAAELEREILLADAAASRDVRRQLAVLAQLDDGQFPPAPIRTDHWEAAALGAAGGEPGGAFCDWRLADDDTLTVCLGAAGATGMLQTLHAHTLRGAVKSALLANLSTDALVRHLAEVAWTSTSAPVESSFISVALPPDDGPIRYSSAGPLGAVVVRAARSTAFSQGLPPLGADPDARYPAAAQQVAVGEAVVLVSDSLRKAVDSEGRQLGEAAIAE
ncbi:MAG: GAF domain-containing protein, partial [Planctomycetales bacterium]|nr:GAF domain-containing protein [Planctomycetales bacterium]